MTTTTHLSNHAPTRVPTRAEQQRDARALAPLGLDTAQLRVGLPQRAGAITVVPLFGHDRGSRFAAPTASLKLLRVEGYGNVELRNDGEGLAIVPLHIGWIQDRAQNHALCRSALLASGQKLMFRDACCVQAAQGGYLEGREQWFFVLPAELRERALALRGVEGYSKLWQDISQVNAMHGLSNRGHLDELITRRRARLTQQASRFERLPGQTGALVLYDAAHGRSARRDLRLLGVEIAPTPRYFADVWPALARFCYGPRAMRAERIAPAPVAPLQARSLGELRPALEARRAEVERELFDALAATPAMPRAVKVEEKLLGVELCTVEGGAFVGQLARDGDEVLYASLTAAPESLPS